jgi:hypothetical protein
MATARATTTSGFTPIGARALERFVAAAVARWKQREKLEQLGPGSRHADRLTIVDIGPARRRHPGDLETARAMLAKG